MSDISERLKQRLRYDEMTGQFFWLNYGARTGKPAGSIRKDGYVEIKVDRKHYLAHRLAWFFTYGVWPGPHLDHDNHNPTDNRISNLVDRGVVGNALNRNGRNSNNTTGYRGITKLPTGRYMAVVQGKYLGSFGEIKNAAKAVEKALTNV